MYILASNMQFGESLGLLNLTTNFRDLLLLFYVHKFPSFGLPLLLLYPWSPIRRLENLSKTAIVHCNPACYGVICTFSGFPYPPPSGRR